MMCQDDSNEIRRTDRTGRGTGRSSLAGDGPEERGRGSSVRDAEARREEERAPVVVPIGRARRPAGPRKPTPPDDDPGPQAA